MTRVTLYRNARGDITGFSCKGHSGYAEEGSDIVCAAVSALSITCANALCSVAGLEPETTEKDGFLTVRLREEQSSHDSQVILRTFEQGISDMAASYPKYISFTALVK